MFSQEIGLTQEEAELPAQGQAHPVLPQMANFHQRLMSISKFVSSQADSNPNLEARVNPILNQLVEVAQECIAENHGTMRDTTGEFASMYPEADKRRVAKRKKSSSEPNRPKKHTKQVHSATHDSWIL